MLIGIAGRKRSGKSTLARGLSAALDLPEHSFAEPLRAFIAHILGMTLDELDAAKEKPVKWLDGVTPRQMLQSCGTEWGRNTIHWDIWVRSLLARIPTTGAIISDVRFPNEAEAILAANGIVILLERDTIDADAHVSEAPLPARLITFRLRNNSTQDALVDNALEVIARLQSVA